MLEMFGVKADFYFIFFVLHSEERRERWDLWQDAAVQEEGQRAPDLGLKDGAESLYVFFFLLLLCFFIISLLQYYSHKTSNFVINLRN